MDSFYFDPNHASNLRYLRTGASFPQLGVPDVASAKASNHARRAWITQLAEQLKQGIIPPIDPNEVPGKVPEVFFAVSYSELASVFKQYVADGNKDFDVQIYNFIAAITRAVPVGGKLTGPVGAVYEDADGNQQNITLEAGRGIAVPGVDKKVEGYNVSVSFRPLYTWNPAIIQTNRKQVQKGAEPKWDYLGDRAYSDRQGAVIKGYGHQYLYVYGASGVQMEEEIPKMILDATGEQSNVVCEYHGEPTSYIVGGAVRAAMREATKELGRSLQLQPTGTPARPIPNQFDIGALGSIGGNASPSGISGEAEMSTDFSQLPDIKPLPPAIKQETQTETGALPQPTRSAFGNVSVLAQSAGTSLRTASSPAATAQAADASYQSALGTLQGLVVDYTSYNWTPYESMENAWQVFISRLDALQAAVGSSGGYAAFLLAMRSGNQQAEALLTNVIASLNSLSTIAATNQ